MNENLEGAQFLHEVDSTLHTGAYVEKIQNQLDLDKRSQKPSQKISSWLEVLEKTHGHNDSKVNERIFDSYFEQYLIKKENIPNSFYATQQRLAEERGEGKIKITPELRDSFAEITILDQKNSLLNWLEYLTMEDTDMYPVWLKYWIFTGVVKLGKYDEEKKSFLRRSKSTIVPFPDLNREALSYVADQIQRKVKGEPSNENLLKNQNFGTYYLHAIEKVTPTRSRFREEDFYYTYDNEECFTILGGVVKAFGKEGELYENKASDMIRVTEICSRVSKGTELNIEDLRFLYEIDRRIEGFGYRKDPRINNLLERRNIKEDLSLITGYSADEISITTKDALSGNIKFHYGDIDLSELTSAEGLVFPETVIGSIYLDELRSAEDLKFPEIVGGILFLDELRSAEGLIFPETVRGGLYLNGLRSAKGLKLPEIVRGSLYLNELTSAEDLKLPERVEGSLSLNGLTSAEGLKMPEIIEGNLYLNGLNSAKGLKLPEIIGGDLDFSGFNSSEELKLPEIVGGDINLGRLEFSEGLILPKTVGGDIYLYKLLISPEELKLPEIVGGSLYLGIIRSAEGLKFPKRIKGNLGLSRLKSSEGLKLPERVEGNLYLNSLNSAKGLKLPRIVKGDLNLSSLASTEGLIFPKTVGRDLKLSGLTSSKDLELPEIVEGSLYFNKLSSTERQSLKLKYPNIKIYPL